MEPASEPIFSSGVGPSVSFAAEYLSGMDQGVNVVLVTAARGGTSIQEWMPSRVDGKLYTEAVKRTLAASHLGKVRGVLFFQGERDALSDTGHPGDWDVYFEKMIFELRKDLSNPNLPVVFAQLGSGSKPKWKMVKDSQERVDLDNSSMIKTDDLPYGDGIHFKTSSYVEIGKRFARALKQLDQTINTE